MGWCHHTRGYEAGCQNCLDVLKSERDAMLAATREPPDQISALMEVADLHQRENIRLRAWLEWILAHTISPTMGRWFERALAGEQPPNG